MTMRWGTEKTTRFIEEYEKHDCLWDQSHELYKNQNARDGAYRGIIMTMGEPYMDIKAVRTKIRSLRNTYNLEIAKIAKAKCNGSELYVPTIAWFSKMNFLKDTIIENPSIENPLDISNVDCVMDAYIETEINHTHDHIPTISLQARVPRPPKRAYPSTPLEIAVNALKEIATLPPVHQNEFDIFGKSVGVQLQQLPIKNALETQEMIQRLLRQQRLKALNERKSELSPKIEDFINLNK